MNRLTAKVTGWASLPGLKRDLHARFWRHSPGDRDAPGGYSIVEPLEVRDGLEAEIIADHYVRRAEGDPPAPLGLIKVPQGDFRPLRAEFEGGVYVRPLNRGVFIGDLDRDETLESLMSLLVSSSLCGDGWGSIRLTVEVQSA